MTIICVHLCSSVVNNEIEIIPACFLSAYALSVDWESCACGSLGCWRLLPAAAIAVEIYNLCDI